MTDRGSVNRAVILESLRIREINESASAAATAALAIPAALRLASRGIIKLKQMYDAHQGRKALSHEYQPSKTKRYRNNRGQPYHLNPLDDHPEIIGHSAFPQAVHSALRGDDGRQDFDAAVASIAGSTKGALPIQVATYIRDGLDVHRHNTVVSRRRIPDPDLKVSKMPWDRDEVLEIGAED